MALGNSKLGKNSSDNKDRPTRTKYDLGNVLPDVIRHQAKQTKANVSGMATYLILQGLKSVENGTADDIDQYLTDTDNFAFLHGWDYKRLEKEAGKIMKKLER